MDIDEESFEDKMDGRRVMIRRTVLLMFAAALQVATTAQGAAQSPTAAGDGLAVPVATPLPVFDVTAVRISKSGDSGSHSNFQNGRFTASNVALKHMMQYQAYGVTDVQIVGGPKWLNSARFDIEAKADDAVIEKLPTLDRDQRRRLMQGMFQQLLADRFKLAVHWETRGLPVYALVVVGKTMLEPAKHPESGVGINSTTGTFAGDGVTMTDLARALTQELSGEVGRVIVDKTGIEGRYDVALKWTPDEGGPSAENGSVEAGPSIFTAMQEQLGLKLEAGKAPVQVLVIDHVEMPLGN